MGLYSANFLLNVSSNELRRYCSPSEHLHRLFLCALSIFDTLLSVVDWSQQVPFEYIHDSTVTTGCIRRILLIGDFSVHDEEEVHDEVRNNTGFLLRVSPLFPSVIGMGRCSTLKSPVAVQPVLQSALQLALQPLSGCISRRKVTAQMVQCRLLYSSRYNLLATLPAARIVGCESGLRGLLQSFGRKALVLRGDQSTKLPEVFSSLAQVARSSTAKIFKRST